MADKNNLKNISEDSYNKRYVSFSLNAQTFAFDIEHIVEVIPVYPITKVFHTPVFVSGVINLRGDIIAIIDLNLFFNLQSAATETTGNTKIIITRRDEKICGFIVDSVAQIDAIEEVRKESIPSSISKDVSDYLKGLTVRDSKPVLIINIDNILNSEKIKQFT